MYGICCGEAHLFGDIPRCESALRRCLIARSIFLQTTMNRTSEDLSHHVKLNRSQVSKIDCVDRNIENRHVGKRYKMHLGSYTKPFSFNGLAFFMDFHLSRRLSLKTAPSKSAAIAPKNGFFCCYFLIDNVMRVVFISCKLVVRKIGEIKLFIFREMKNILVVQSPQERKESAIQLDQKLIPRLEQCWHADTMREAVRLIRRHKPSLVVLDVDIEAGLDFELFERTKNLSYQKIILCDTDEYAFKVMRFSIDDYLLKPAAGPEVMVAIQKLLFRQQKYSIQQLYNLRKPVHLATVTQVFLQTSVGPVSLDLADVVRVQDQIDQRILFMVDGTQYSCALTLKRLTDLFYGNSFVRLATDQVVNCLHLQAITMREGRLYVTMQDEHTVRVPLRAEDRIQWLLQERNISLQPPMEDGH